VQRSDLSAVRGLLAGGGRAVVSLAPSFPAAIGRAEPGQLVSALRRLGFLAVQETVSVLPEVVRRRSELLAGAGGPLIGTSCPVIVRLVRRDFPGLVSRLAEMVSPMIWHAAKFKERYGQDTAVVFIGPCPAKRAEARGEPVDYALTFKDLLGWLREAGVEMAALPPRSFDVVPPDWARLSVLVSRVSGVSESRALLRSLAEGPFDNREPEFLELLACRGGCLNGPGMGVSLPLAARRQRVMDFVTDSRGPKR